MEFINNSADIHFDKALASLGSDIYTAPNVQDLDRAGRGASGSSDYGFLVAIGGPDIWTRTCDYTEMPATVALHSSVVTKGIVALLRLRFREFPTQGPCSVVARGIGPEIIDGNSVVQEHITGNLEECEDFCNVDSDCFAFYWQASSGQERFWSLPSDGRSNCYLLGSLPFINRW